MTALPAVDAPLRLRDATIADAAPIAGLIIAAFGIYRGWLDPQPSALKETPETIARQLAGHRGVVAEIAGGPVGCALFRPHGADFYLGRLSVLPQWHGRGIARALIEYVEAAARDAGAAGITVEVRVALPQNQRLFAAAGFREVARHAHPGFDHPTSIELRKPLRD